MKKRTILLVTALLIGVFGNALSYTELNDRQISMLIPSEQRISYALAGNWERSEDDGSSWEQVKLPVTEVTKNKIIYRRVLKIDRNIREKFAWHLNFLGIDHQVEIYLNDQFVGRYFGNLTPFDVRIPDRMITNESNMLKLVFAPPTGASKQIKTQHLFAKEMYSGLIRELFLVGTPNVWLNSINFVQEFSSDLSQCSIKGEFSVSSGKIESLYRNSAIGDSVRQISETRVKVNIDFELIDPATGEIIAKGQTKNFDIENERTLTDRFSISVNSPKLWSPENPKLYDLKTRISAGGILIDDYITSVGFRKVHTRGKDVFLNNSKFEIKGVTYIEDVAQDLETLSPKRIEEDLNLIKTLGANTIRFKFTTPNRYMAELCNRLGLFMLVELPCYDVPGDILDLEEIKVNMKNIAKQFLSSFNTHPALLGLGIASGTKESSEGFKSFAKSIIDIYRASSDKLIYKIVPFGSTVINSEDFDLIGFKDVRKNTDFNYVNKEIKRLVGLSGNKPTFFAYGTIIHPENNNGYSDPLSVEFQAYNILNSYKIVEENRLAGSVVNTFNDYRLENPILLADNPNVYLGAFGLFDRTRKQRPSYTTLQALYNNETEPLLNAGSFTESTPVSYIIFSIAIALVLILMVNRFKRFREYFFRSILRPYNFYADIRDQRIMSSFHTFILAVVISMTLAIYVSSILYYYKTNELAQYIMMMLVKWDSVQEALYRIIWMPEVTTLIVTVLILLTIVIISLLIRLFALIMRARIFFNDAFTIAVWSLMPMILLLPVALVLLRLLVISQSSIVLFLLLLALMVLWSLFRLLRASSVVFDKPSGKVYTLGVFVMILIIGFPLGYYQIQYSLILYAQYFVDVLLKM